MHTNYLFKLLTGIVIVVLSLTACGKQAPTAAPTTEEVHVVAGELRVVPEEASPGQTLWIYLDKIEVTGQVNYTWTVNGESVAGQNTSAIQYQVPQDAKDGILVTVSVTAQDYHQELSTVVKISNVTRPISGPISDSTPLPAPRSPSCGSSAITADLYAYDNKVSASGTIQYCSSSAGKFDANVEVQGLPPNESYVFTLQAAEGETYSQTNSLLAQTCNTQTPKGDFYCDIPLSQPANNAGDLQSPISFGLAQGSYTFKFLLKDTKNDFDVVMVNDSPSSVAITQSLGIQKGMTYVSWQAGGFSAASADQALEELKATGANWIALVVTGYQENVNSQKISIDSPKTPTDNDVKHVIEKARQLGFSVMLKPHIDLYDNGFRGDIGKNFNVADWETWFTAYREFITHYAALAAQDQDVVKIFCVGTELVTTSSKDAEWKQVLQEVRNQYAGPLVYASNWNEPAREWWKDLDYIGVDAYFPLKTASDSPTVEDLKSAWQPHVATLENLHNQLGIPVIFTELGYPSAKGAHIKPWDNSVKAVDLNEQANLYQAALETFSNKDWLAGIYWWNWLTNPNQGGIQDTDYTPHGKPAENILINYVPSTPPSAAGAPLTLYSGGDSCTSITTGASGEVLFETEMKGAFQATLKLNNLTPQHGYVFALNCKDGDSSCLQLLATATGCSTDYGGYCDIQGLGLTDATGSLEKKIMLTLPLGSYDMKFFVKDPGGQFCNLLYNDSPGSFTVK